jgi:DNA polymerase V
MEKTIGIIDLKSFYASCECSCRHLDPFRTPLVCCDPYRGPSSIVMSATPYLKKHYGIPNVCRRQDLPLVKGMIYAQPRMSYYLQMSARAVSIFLDFVAEEDLHVYSVDESFLNLGPYLNLYGCSAETIIQRIQQRIADELGLVATAGIGPNMFLAKCALDLEGKKKEPYLAHWDYADVPAKLWSVPSVQDLWGISTGISAHLERIGIRSVYALAHAELALLEKEFGIMGDQLYDLANGRDDSDIEDKYVPVDTSLSNGQTLHGHYSKEDGLLLLREMNDDLAARLRKTGSLVQKISLWVAYSGGMGAYAKQRALPLASDDTDTLFEALRGLYEAGVEDLPLAGLSIAYGKLAASPYEQLSLFEKPEDNAERHRLDASLDAIRARYGLNSVFRCSALKEKSTARLRHEQIGGHKQ